ncbi:MAG: S9 family peptidase [Ignavibacteria bacterium]|nr:S9 family peptidase [Ignavibacteria bacterium]
MKKLFLFFVLLFFIQNINLISQNKRIFTSEDLWQMKRLSNLTVSPDGKYGCFVVTEYNIKENKGNSDLWLIDLKTYQTKRLTTNLNSDNSPVWHPDSRKIAFISKREGDYPQLYEIDIDGGEARLLYEMPMGISNPQYSKDGKRIFFVSKILPEFENDLDGLKKELKARKEKKVSAKVTENRFYRYWDSWLTDGFVSRVYVLDLETKELKDLMKGWNKIFNLDGGISFSISPDGKWLSFVANSTEPPYDSLNADVYLLNIDKPEEVKNITQDNFQDDSAPYFSKDGKYLFFGSQFDPDYSADNVRLMVYNLTNGITNNLTEQYDFSFFGFTQGDDLNKIYMLAEDRAKISLFEYDLLKNKLEKIYTGGSINSVNIKNQKAYFLKSTISEPQEIFEFDLKSKALKKISKFNDELMSQIKFGKVEEHYFIGAEGDSVQLYLVYPPDFDATKKYPLVHLIHGGPHGTFGDDFHYRWNAQLFAAPGYVIAMVNFHGSTSFGKNFGKSIVGAHGDKPFTDIMLSTDFLIRKFNFIDSTKMAAAGGSYGGYLVNWIAGHTNRFKALISHAGVYNLMGQFASDLTYERVKNYDGAPWQGRYENINRWNPAFFAHNFQTPMLIIHGEKDYRVVVTQGLEIYGVLKGKGIPARLVYYPDENHWILQPQNSIYWYQEVHNWFKKYLGE